MIVRPAIPLDAAAIAHVHVATWRATYAGIVPQTYLDDLSEADFTGRWTDWLTRPDILICVAETDGTIIGFASGGPIRKPKANCDAELYAIYLLSEMQHRGVGQKLVAHVEHQLIQHNHKQILAWVLRDNPATLFYAHLGGEIVAEDLIEIGGVTLPELAYAWPLNPRA